MFSVTDTDALASGEQRAHLRLHVSRESRDTARCQLQRAWGSVGQNRNLVIADIDVEAAARQRVGDGAHMFRFHALDGYSFPRDCTCNQKCSSFDPVGNYVVFGAVQLFHAFDDDPARAGAFDLRAHLVQEIRQVDYLGLPRRPFDNRDAIGQHGRHHDVVGAEDSRAEFTLQVDDCAAEFRREDLDVAALDAHRRAERFESFEVQINWPIANDAAAGQSDGRFLATAQGAVPARKPKRASCGRRRTARRSRSSRPSR